MSEEKDAPTRDGRRLRRCAAVPVDALSFLQCLQLNPFEEDQIDGKQRDHLRFFKLIILRPVSEPGAGRHA